MIQKNCTEFCTSLQEYRKVFGNLEQIHMEESYGLEVIENRRQLSRSPNQV